MVEMRKSTAPPAPSDISPLLQGMLDNGHAVEARALWGRLFRHADWPLPDILDAGFDEPVPAAESKRAPSVFEWQFDATAEIYADVDLAGAKGHTLHIVRAGIDQRAFAQQRLALQPGPWLLSLGLRSDLPDMTSRLRIGLRCNDGGLWLTQPLAEPTQANDWHTVMLRFTVAEPCRSQTLTFEPIGTAPGDDVGVWIDNLAVQPEKR
jgi:hypothetical protein